MTVRLGVTLPQFTDDPDAFISAAHRAREAGLDSVWVFDHLWPLSGGKERPIFECWSALAFLAAETEDIGIGTLVTRSSLRHPAVIGKMAATIAAIAPGRLTVAIGSGDRLSRGENESYGLPYFAGDDRHRQLISTTDAVRRYLSERRVSLSDDYTALQDLPASPPVDEPVEVWIGGRSTPVLEAAGRVADGWNAWGGGAERFARDAGVVRAAAGREVRLTWGGLAVLAEDEDAAREKLGRRDPGQYVTGAPDALAAHLGALAEAGASHLVVTFPDPAEPSNYELLGGRVRDLAGV